MLLRWVLLFTLVPAVEIYLLIRVGGWIGAGNTVLLIIATGVGGAHYTRQQGLEVVRRMEAALAAGRPPAVEIVDGALLLVGGALLITPGFVTDLAGFSMVFPPTRAMWRGAVMDWLRRRIERGEIVIRRW